MISIKLFVVLSMTIVVTIDAKKYNPCDLAQELVQKHGFSRELIYDWICLVEAESSFKTEAINDKNSNGSSDHGLFQVSSWEIS